MQAAHAVLDEETRPADPPPGCTWVEGHLYRRDAKGALMPDELVNAQDKLEDETVRKVAGYAAELSAQIRRFREHSFDDVDMLLAILAQDYGDLRGGTKGNVTLYSFDGLLKVQVAIADLITFGPQLQTAKSLFDQCMTEWAADSRPEIRGIIQRAFDVDKEGKINRTELLSLLRFEIEDERWLKAMKAIRDSIRVIGTKRYCRIYQRTRATDKWEAVSLDVASA
ncbi:MAG: DUF3164 family protein [Caulobacter sp.]|nr:DUF3164 family protein [Caulobacter sp.]